MTEGQTPQRKKDFIAAFARCGNVTKACEELGLDRKAIYRWRERDKHFEAAFKHAELEAVEHLEKEAQRRAVQGWEEPVYQGGEKVGTVRKFSDTLLIFLLKGAAPEKYRERVDNRVSGGIATIDVSDTTTPEQRGWLRDAVIRGDVPGLS